ncbi:MAG TPA: nuclear transport factor 2 family protein [Chitinophagaceae bacterium]
MRKTLLLLFIVAIAFCSFGQSSGEAKVWARVEALTKALFETKDSMALMDIVSANVTYGHSAGNIEDKALMIRNAITNKSTYRNNAFEKVSIDVQGKTALVRHNFRALSTDAAGKESPLELGIMQVWKKENGKWRLWARQAFRLPPKN